MGFTLFSASMLTGGNLGTGLPLKDFFVAVIIGNLILACYKGVLAYIGADTGLSMHLLAIYSFGVKGSYLASFITSITQIGWFGVGIAMFATPDFARFSKIKKVAVSTTVVAFFIGNSLMFLFGEIGAMVTGNSDIADVMFSQGLIIPAILVLGLNIWTTNDNAIYTAGLGLSNITKLPKNKLVIISGLIVTVGINFMILNF